MSYHWFARQEILQKAKGRYSKEKAAEYYLQNKDAIREKSREHYKNLKSTKRKGIKNWFSTKKKH